MVPEGFKKLKEMVAGLPADHVTRQSVGKSGAFFLFGSLGLE